MPSSFTPFIGLQKPADGEQDQIWGDTVNADLDLIDAAMGWYKVGSATLSAPASGFTIPLPSRFQFYRLIWRDVAPAVSSALDIRYSIDNGVTYFVTNEYSIQSSTEAGSVSASVGGSGSPRLFASPATTAAGLGTWGSHEFYTVSARFGQSVCSGFLSTGGMFVTRGSSAVVNNPGTLTHLQLAFEGGSMLTGAHYDLIGRPSF